MVEKLYAPINIDILLPPVKLYKERWALWI